MNEKELSMIEFVKQCSIDQVKREGSGAIQKAMKERMRFLDRLEADLKCPEKQGFSSKEEYRILSHMHWYLSIMRMDHKEAAEKNGCAYHDD